VDHKFKLIIMVGAFCRYLIAMASSHSLMVSCIEPFKFLVWLHGSGYVHLSYVETEFNVYNFLVIKCSLSKK
jgi:hypothetical protein